MPSHTRYSYFSKLEHLVTYKIRPLSKKIILESADRPSLIILFCYGTKIFSCLKQDVRSMLQQST